MTQQQKPGAFYGVNVEGAEKPVMGVGDDRPSASPRRMESTMSIPGARQIPVEGAVTGPNAPPAQVDAVFSHVDLDKLEFPDE